MLLVMLVLASSNSSWAQAFYCPDQPADYGHCDTLHIVPWSADTCFISCWYGGCDTTCINNPGENFPCFLYLPIFVTHDSNTYYWAGGSKWVQDSIRGFVIPLSWTHTNPSAYCSLSEYWNNDAMVIYNPNYGRSIWRDFGGMQNRMNWLAMQFEGLEWSTRTLDMTSGSLLLALYPTEWTNRSWWEGDRTLLATLTFRIEDTMYVQIDTSFWPPNNGLHFVRYEGTEIYVPKHNLPLSFGAAFIYVTSPNGGEIWRVDSTYDITWNYTNIDSVKIEYSTDGGYSWLPIVDSTESDGVYSWQVPNTPSQTCRVRICEISGAPCDVSDAEFFIFIHTGPDVVAGHDQAGATKDEVPVMFYIHNNGILTETYDLYVTSSLGWDIEPQHLELTLYPDQIDTASFTVSIPNVPLGTSDRVRLVAIPQSNPYAGDSDSLTVYCIYYNIEIAQIADVPNDQGKQVRIEWLSFTDFDSSVTFFTIFRRIDSLLFAPGVSGHNLFEVSDSFALRGYPPGQWEIVTTVPAFGETLYATIVPTLKDSTILEGMYYSLFFIRAGTDNPYFYFDSPIDSGYSLDNLSPSPPEGLFASHEPAVTKLTWSPTTALDFDYYTLYRDTLSEFTPDPSNRLGFTIDTTFIDSTAQLGRAYYYVASATDFSGNESDPSNEAMGVRYITGDANTDGEVNLADAVYIVNYLFIGGSAPDPMQAGDANCDGGVDLADAVYLVNYLFIGGPPPCEP